MFGTRQTLDDLTFDTTMPGGVGHSFERIEEDHYRFRARIGTAPYSWRLCVRINSPGDGRQVVLEVADFNHFGGDLWQERAAVISEDGVRWDDLGVENIEITDYTATGDPALDETIDDGWHPPYGVRFHLTLDAPDIWLASPTPFTLRHNDEHLQRLAHRADEFTVESLTRTRFTGVHGCGLRLCTALRGDPEEKIRVMVIAGEHPAEVAGMYAAEGLLDEVYRQRDLLSDFAFWVIPAVNVDGIALGRTYHAPHPDDPGGEGINISRDWDNRSLPEGKAIWRLIEQVDPHCLVSLHNGRHRRKLEVWAPPHPQLAGVMDHLRDALPLPPEHWRPAVEEQLVTRAADDAGVDLTLLIETLLLEEAPGCVTFRESYRRIGMHILRGLTAALREIHGLPPMIALADNLHSGPLRCRAADFTETMPWLYEADVDGERELRLANTEINGLPLKSGWYDVWLKLTGDTVPQVQIKGDEPEVYTPVEGWALIPSFPVFGRMVSFDVPVQQADTYSEIVIAAEGTPHARALDGAEPYDRYTRDVMLEDTPFDRWGEFSAILMRDGFGIPELQEMFDDIVDWAARRQVTDPGSTYHGAVYSEEDKYDARDAAAAAVCFTRRWKDTDDERWKARAKIARKYVYRSQIHEPQNSTRDGGFVHMVHGIWGTQFTRLFPPYPGIDGIDTSAIIHMLCSVIEQGLAPDAADTTALFDAASWIANNEALPGMFLHHEGATHDCQNSNSLCLSALARAYHALSPIANPPEVWIDAIRRGLRHYLEGQEAIGVWPYRFADVTRRGGAYHFRNIPDHGIGLYHLTRVADRPPICDYPGLSEALRRAARWYLGVCRIEDEMIDLQYNTAPDLGDDICFSGFTWCRFTAAAALLRIARITGEVEPWRHLALRLMEYVRARRWQISDPLRAPVIAHARPEAKLATWCQAAEWDAVILAEMIDDLEVLDD